MCQAGTKLSAPLQHFSGVTKENSVRMVCSWYWTHDIPNAEPTLYYWVTSYVRSLL